MLSKLHIIALTVKTICKSFNLCTLSLTLEVLYLSKVFLVHFAMWTVWVGMGGGGGYTKPSSL